MLDVVPIGGGGRGDGCTTGGRGDWPVAGWWLRQSSLYTAWAP